MENERVCLGWRSRLTKKRYNHTITIHVEQINWWTIGRATTWISQNMQYNSILIDKILS